MRCWPLHRVQLPAAACLNPSPSYYKQFNGACVRACLRVRCNVGRVLMRMHVADHPLPSEGYTLGLLCAELFMGFLWLLGSKVIAPLSLRNFTPAQRADRLAQFNVTVLARLLLMLYLVYPGVCVSIFGIFSCTTFASGRSFLDADYNLTCYNGLHLRYVGVAIFWLFCVTVGIPLFFLWLLRHFKVPQLAEVIADNAWLREAVQLCWQERCPQPDIDVRKLTIDSITLPHLESIYAFLCHDASSDEAAEILAGARPGVDIKAASPRKKDAAEEDAMLKSKLLGGIALARMNTLRALEAAHGKLAHAARMCTGGKLEHAPDPEHSRRREVLQALLLWCKTSGDLSLPPQQWQEVEEEEEHNAETEADPDGDGVTAEDKKRASRAPPAGRVHSEDIPAVQTRAMKEVGFLFAAYRSDCWFWCAAFAVSASLPSC